MPRQQTFITVFVLALATTSLGIVAAQQLMSSGWPAYRADAAHSSFAPTMHPRTGPPSSTLWTFSGTTSQTLSAVVVDATADQAYFVVLEERGDATTLHAVQATTGLSLWNYTLTGFIDVYGSHAFLSLLDDGSVIAVTRSAVHRVSTAGAALWVTQQTQTVLDLDALVADGLVIVTAGLCGTGAVRDRRGGAKAHRRAVQDPAGAASATAPPYSHAAFSLADGSLAWSYVEHMPGNGGFCSTPVLGAPGLLFITTQEITSESYWWGIRFNSSAAWTVLNGSFPDTGNPDIGSDWNAVVGGRFIAPYSDESGVEFRIAAVDVATGAATLYTDARGCWQQNGICGSFSGGVGPDGTTPRVMQIQPDDGTDYDAVLNVFAADNLGDTGLLWSASIGPGPTDPLLNVPVVCDGRGNVYAAYNRTLSGFAHDGTRMWTWQSPGEIVAQPAWPSAPTTSEPNAGASALADVAIITYYGGASDGAAPRMHIAAITWAPAAAAVATA